MGLEKLRQMSHQFSLAELALLEETQGRFRPGPSPSTPARAFPSLQALPRNTAPCPRGTTMTERAATGPGDRAAAITAVIGGGGAGHGAVHPQRRQQAPPAGRDCAAPELAIASHRRHHRLPALQAGADRPRRRRAGGDRRNPAGEGQVLPFEPHAVRWRRHPGRHRRLQPCRARPALGESRPRPGAGVQLIDGRGQLLHFGGRVMKNVAGYDVRLQAGALGVLSEISLKVLPGPGAA